jgi:general secretion pathway protein F
MSRFRPLPLPVRALLFQHLAAMEKAGVPAEKAYALLDLGPAARSRADTFRRLVARAVDPPTAGANSGLFTVFETRLLRAAFACGSPLPTYQRLARQHAVRASQMAALRARLLLPAAILTLALLVQPLPRLFSGALGMPGYLARTALPLMLIAGSGMLATFLGTWFAAGTAAPWRPALERLLLALPLFGKLHLRRNARDFNESLAMLLEAGVGLFEALPAALATVDNHIVRADLAALLPAVKAGATLAQAIGRLRVVDTVQLFAFVHTGEQSGTLPEMLMRHADAESEALALAQHELMTWLPRVLYAMVALWMASQLLAPRTAGDVAALGMPQWLR